MWRSPPDQTGPINFCGQLRAAGRPIRFRSRRGASRRDSTTASKTTDRVELWWDSIAARRKPGEGRAAFGTWYDPVRCTTREVGREQTRAKSYCTMEEGGATQSLGNESHKGYELGQNCYRNCGYRGGRGRR